MDANPGAVVGRQVEQPRRFVLLQRLHVQIVAFIQQIKHCVHKIEQVHFCIPPALLLGNA